MVKVRDESSSAPLELEAFDEMLGASYTLIIRWPQLHALNSSVSLFRVYWALEINISLDAFICRKSNNSDREIPSNVQDN